MSAMGRGGDNMVAHLSQGDVVIPRDIILNNPEFLTKFKKAMQDMGGDYRSHIAGSGFENYNPETGAPEFFFSGLKNFFKNPVKQINRAVDDPMGAISNSVRTSIPGQFLPGTKALMNLLDPLIGVQSSSGGSIGGGESGALPPSNIGPIGDSGQPIEQEFKATRPNQAVKPYDLFSSSVGGQSFDMLDPTQQRSYLATRGSQGGGLGDEEQNYYMNILQRNLIDEGGNMQDINSALLPIERNYLTRLGLPTGNTASFFQALQG